MAFDPTPEQRANLAKLADHLDALPDDYRGFAMADHYTHDDNSEMRPGEASSALPGECGACACAIGHGPSAGIPVCQDDWYWEYYASRVFGTWSWDTDEGSFMFGSDQPDDPKAAAVRIRQVLAGQFPPAASTVPINCLLYTSPSPRDKRQSRMPSSA